MPFVSSSSIAMAASVLSLGSVLCAPTAGRLGQLEKSSDPVYYRIYAPCTGISSGGDDDDYSLIEDVYTRDECKDECSEYGDFCNAYEYHEDGKKCWKWLGGNKVESAFSDRGGKGETCVVKQTDGKPFYSFKGLCRKNEGLDKTTDISSYPGIDQDACEDKCKADNKCKAYHYSAKKEECELQFSEIHYIEEAPDSKTVCVVKFLN